MQETAIVIGATGLIGVQVVNALISAEHITRVVTITRRPMQYNSEKVENHVVDFDHLNECAYLFKGGFLFSCLGTTVKQAGSIQAQRVVDLDHQYTAATLAHQQGVSHYLLVSSSGANARSVSPYLKMKGELEQKVMALPFKSISIFQPSLLLGERDQGRMGESLGRRVLPLLCRLPGLKRYRPIDGLQVAQKMVQVSAKPGVGLEKFTLDEVFPSVRRPK